MRIITVFLAVTTLGWPSPATAQAQPAAPAAPSVTPAQTQAAEVDEDALPTTVGTFEFGARGTAIDGDAARFERYRDMGDGLMLENARYRTVRNGWNLRLGADHVGRRDQRYMGEAIMPGRVKLWGQWDQIPMLMSRTTQTLFEAGSGQVLSIDDALQGNVPALAAALPNARTFELGSRRHILEAGTQIIADLGLTFDANVRHIDRDGAIPYGGSFGHGNVVETIAPTQHGLTDFDTSAEYQRGDLLVRGGYGGSWFRNEITSILFDNPYRALDAVGGGSRGQLSLAPNNSYINVNGMISYRMPYRSRATIYASKGTLKDDGDPIVPFTVNTALPAVALDRPSVQGEAGTSAVNLSFTSRPTRMLDVDLRFRTYEYDNRTPPFTLTQRVAYDNNVGTINPPSHTEPFGLNRSTFDADVRLRPLEALSGTVGYSRLTEERTHRIFEETTEDVFRILVDSIGNHWFTLRSKYEHGQRRGHGDPARIVEILESVSEQPGMRHFDIASRDRDRVTVTGSVTPLETLMVNASVAAGKDDYLESEFGLRDNHHRVYSAGFDFAPTELQSGGLSYSFERYTALSRSRQANPGQERDASRNWATDSADRSHSLVADWQILGIRENFDLNLSTDYSRSRATYRYITGPVPDRTLPEEADVPTVLPPPSQLPPTRSELFRGTLDLAYWFSEQWRLGTSVWYERYRVTDFSLDAEATAAVDPARAILLGYRYLPYTATTVAVRAIYQF